VLLPAVLACWGHLLAAQTCFPGRPLPRCHSFPVTEIGYSHRLDNTTLATGGDPQVHYFNGEIGWMFNRTPRLALGGTFFVGALVDYDFQLRPGLDARLRYWVNDRTGLDVGAGLFRGRTLVSDGIDFSQRHRIGAAGHLGLSLHDAALFVLRLEYLRSSIDRDLTGYLGARFGSKPAAWTTVIVAPILGLGALIAAD
jgi:hypothetical protein